MIAPDWLLYTLSFFCGAFFTAAILIADLDNSNPADWRAIAIATEQRRIDAMNALNGNDAAIARIEAEIGPLAKHPPREGLKWFLSGPVIPIDRIHDVLFGSDHNKPINKPEPEMNTARQQFNTIQEARAFFAKARANRQTRHGYYECADMLRARLNQHSRFVIGTEFMQ